MYNVQCSVPDKRPQLLGCDVALIMGIVETKRFLVVVQLLPREVLPLHPQLKRIYKLRLEDIVFQITPTHKRAIFFDTTEYRSIQV